MFWQFYYKISLSIFNKLNLNFNLLSRIPGVQLYLYLKCFCSSHFHICFIFFRDICFFILFYLLIYFRINFRFIFQFTVSFNSLTAFFEETLSSAWLKARYKTFVLYFRKISFCRTKPHWGGIDRNMKNDLG